MHPSDSDSCKSWFKYGKSFPENVKDAVCALPELGGATGPTGPMGPIGPSGLNGGGVDVPATCSDILAGINGVTEPTYVDPAGWLCASDRYFAKIWTQNIINQTYYPNAEQYNIFDLTHYGNCIIGEPTNMQNGRTISIVLRQGNTGQNNIIFSPVYEFDGGWNRITLTSGAKDVVVATKINDFYFCTMANDIKK